MIIAIISFYKMYRCLAGQGKQWIFNKNTGARIDKIKSELINLLTPEKNKKQLAHVLKIFPSFFESDYVEEFCKSSNIEKYLSYINNKRPARENLLSVQKYFRQQRQKQIFKKNSFNALNSMNIIYLEAYLHWLTNECKKFNTHDNEYLMEVLNLYRPDKWYQMAENTQKRVFIYHHGPTNSGKSTSAIQELKQLNPNQKGIYMAPLRLLAWEYQQKLGNCSLITGQEKEYKNSNLVSCTIEAAQLKEEYQVAVIDEIQMIRDVQRGWSWTRAILSVKAKRVHLCGDERALGIITKLLQLTGDTLQQRRYSRLSKLMLIHKNFKLDKIEAGDCIINFSMNKLINHRNDINKMKNLQMKQSVQKLQKNNQSQKDIPLQNNNYTAIVYGKLPPECRKEQANLFNQNNLPYLVATNAIGMGLNLNIKKIVFMDITRATGDGTIEELEDHQIQQIAGRAGRGKETGYVQCANGHILNRVKKALSTVNQQYGIQLQNLKDEAEEELNSQVLVVDEQKKKKSQKFNSLLQRYMTEKECHIHQACFYFTTDYIIYFKDAMETLMQKELPILNLIKFMKTYTKLSDLYFIQENKHMEYMMNLLENSNYDIADLFTFYNGLSLSMVTQGKNKKFAKQIENAHRNFIQSFVKYRKVKLPKFILTEYEDLFSNYQYMDQISELQGYFNVLETYVWLWNKYQFAFFQIGLAKSIKILLSQKINRILLDNKFKQKQQQKRKLNKQSQNSQNKKVIFESFEDAKRYRKRQKLNEKQPQTSIKTLIAQKLMAQTAGKEELF